MATRDPQEQLNAAVLYALRAGCFFPVPKPKVGAPVRTWIQWGAIRNLHTAMAAFYGRTEGARDGGRG